MIAETKKRSVLVVDDEEAILFAFKDALSEPQVLIDTFSSIDEVRTVLSLKRYDGAVIDLRLSGTEGYEGFEVIKLVKEHNPSCRVILLTAYARPGIEDEAHATGADLFMEKPVSPETVSNALHSLWQA